MAVGHPRAKQPATWADFLALDEDDQRELIDGVLVEVEMPTVRISDRRGVMPDLQYFGRESARVLAQQALTEGHPDLAVEVVSETSRRHDRVTKLGWYAEIGTPEYWIVAEAHTLERLILREGRFVIAEALAEDAVFRPESFPGLEIPLPELWTLPGEGTDSPAEGET